MSAFAYVGQTRAEFDATMSRIGQEQGGVRGYQVFENRVVDATFDANGKCDSVTYIVVVGDKGDTDPVNSLLSPQDAAKSNGVPSKLGT